MEQCNTHFKSQMQQYQSEGFQKTTKIPFSGRIEEKFKTDSVL